MTKNQQRQIILSIEYCAFLGAIFLAVYSVIKSQWEVTAASLAVIAAILANFNSQRISWKQEDELEANIEINFDLKTINKMVLLVIENIGGSRAYDIEFTIEPPLKVISYGEISTGAFPYIENKDRIQYYVSDTATMFEENEGNKRPHNYKVNYKFSQIKDGTKTLKTKNLTIEPFRRTTSPDSDYEKFILESTKISGKLDKIEKAITKISK